MKFESVINTISAVSSLVMCLIRIRKDMYMMLYKIFVVDDLLGTKYDILEKNEKCLRIQIMSLTSTVFIIYAAQMFVSNYDFSLSTLSDISIYACSFIKLVTIMQYVNLISLLRQKFQILNNYLAPAENPTQHRTNNNLWEMLLQTSCFSNEGIWKDDALQLSAFYQALNRRHNSNIMLGSTNISIQNSWLRKEKLRFRALRIIWDVLCDISSSVNFMYGLQILLCIVAAFINITSTLSYSIISINTKVSPNAKVDRDFLLPIILATIEFLLLLWIAATCSAACGEANRSVTLLQKLLLQPELQPATAAEIQLFLQQVRDRTPKFTAWGVFTINYSFLGSTVGTIATYLVILVQMQAN
jgi:hypothetical protein